MNGLSHLTSDLILVKFAFDYDTSKHEVREVRYRFHASYDRDMDVPLPSQVRASLETTVEEAYRPRILERHEIITFGETKEPRVRYLDYVRGVKETVLEITHEPIISRTGRILTHRFDMTHRSDDADGFIKLSTLVFDGRYPVADTVQHLIRELASEVCDEPAARALITTRS